MHTMKYIVCNPQVCVLSACCLPKPYLKLVGAGLEESNYMKCVIKVISFKWGGIVITCLLLIWDLGI